MSLVMQSPSSHLFPLGPSNSLNIVPTASSHLSPQKRSSSVLLDASNFLSPQVQPPPQKILRIESTPSPNFHHRSQTQTTGLLQHSLSSPSARMNANRAAALPPPSFNTTPKKVTTQVTATPVLGAATTPSQLPPPIPPPASMLSAKTTSNAAVPSLLTPPPTHTRHRSMLVQSSSNVSKQSPSAQWLGALHSASGAGILSPRMSPKLAGHARSPSLNFMLPRPASASKQQPSALPLQTTPSTVGTPSAAPITSPSDRFIPHRRQVSRAITFVQNQASDEVYTCSPALAGLKLTDRESDAPAAEDNKENSFGGFVLGGSPLDILERRSFRQQFNQQLASSLLQEPDLASSPASSTAGTVRKFGTPRVLFPDMHELTADTVAPSTSNTEHQAQLINTYRAGELQSPVLAPTEFASVAPFSPLSSPTGPTRMTFGVAPSAERAMATRQSFIPSDPTRILDCPGLVNDFYLNLVHWNKQGVLAIALGKDIYLWNQTTTNIDSLPSNAAPGEEADDVTSVRWNEDGTTLAVGYRTGYTRLYDVATKKVIQTMRSHVQRVSTLDWNNHGAGSGAIFASGGLDTQVCLQDVRLAPVRRENIVATYRGHREEVCGLAFALDGLSLASGANDNRLCIWNLRASQSSAYGGSGPTNSTGSSAHLTLTHHRAAVKALAWCPWQDHVLASGGGQTDGHIRFCNTVTGVETHAIDTSSQVCSLQWSRTEKELVSAHGYPEYALNVWKFPSLDRVASLRGHTQRVLHTSLSPDGSTLVSASADETLRFWKVWKPFVGSAAGSTGGLFGQKKDARIENNWIRSPSMRPIR